MKEEDKSQKVANRVKINEMEKKQKKNISAFLRRKSTTFRQNSQR